MNHQKVALKPKYSLNLVLTSVTLVLIGLYVRTENLSALTPLVLLFIVGSIVLLTTTWLSWKSNTYLANIVLPLGTIVVLSIGLLSTGQSLGTLGVGFIVGIIIGVVASIFITTNTSSVFSSVILVVGILIAPSILWPATIANNVLFTSSLMASGVIGSYSMFASSKAQAATHRLVIYNVWVVFIIYVLLSLNFGFWLTVIGMGLGAYLVTIIASYTEDTVSQVQETNASKSAWWKSRKFIIDSKAPNDREVKAFKENLSTLTESTSLDNSLPDRLLLITKHSVELHKEITNLLNHFYARFLVENPEACQIAQEAFLDLPTSIVDRPLYLHIEQLIRLDLVARLKPSTNPQFNKDFVAKVWPSFVNKRNQKIQQLRKSGELHIRLKVKPNDTINPPYTSTGVLIDYEKQGSNKSEIDWQTVLADELSPKNIIPNNTNEAKAVQDFLDWITKIKLLRDQLAKLISNHYEYNIWHNTIKFMINSGDRGIQETFAFVDLLQLYRMHFEAIDLLDGLKENYRSKSFFMIKMIDRKIAECEFGLFTQMSWGKKSQIKLSKLPGTEFGKPQLRLSSQKNTIRIGQASALFAPDIPIFILLRNDFSTDRFEILSGQTKSIELSPGSHEIFIYPRASSQPCMYAEWHIEDTKHTYDLAVGLLSN